MLLGSSLRTVRAVAIGLAASKVLGTNSGEVHSVFERTFNILIDDELVGVAQSGVSRSPINLIIEIPPSENMHSLGLKKGMQVELVEGRILVGGVLEISLEGAELWRPKTRVERCNRLDKIKRNLELAKRLAARKSESEGLGPLLGHVDEIATGKMPQISELNAVAKTVLPQLIYLTRAVRSGNTAEVKKVARKLIGLGPGLSPSADDALSGFTAALWWVSHSLGSGISNVEDINRVIVSQASGTTLLSKQLLQHAARGEVNERVEELLEALLAGGQSEIEPGVEQVLKIGETSGADMMVGLLLGMQMGLGQSSVKLKSIDP